MIPYVVPFVLYLGLTQLASAYPKYYAWSYPALVVVVGGVTFALLYGRAILRPHFRVLPGVVVGLVGIALWIAICQLEWEKQIGALLPSWLQPGPRPAFNPNTAIDNTAARWAFVVMRLTGLALLVPIAEELFWRGFLARWLNSPDWQGQSLGRFTPFSFVVVTLMFTLAHPEWMAAAVYCVLLNLLLSWTRDLWNCVVAHGVSNLVLGVYILWTDSWELW
jgi:CAAX prenyl protease-like protein